MTGVLALARDGWSCGASCPTRRGQPRAARASALREFRKALRDPQLARLNYGIFALHAVLMALFIAVPFALRDAGLPLAEHWKVYLPVMLGSFVLMLPAILGRERRAAARSATSSASVALHPRSRTSRCRGSPAASSCSRFSCSFSSRRSTCWKRCCRRSPRASRRRRAKASRSASTAACSSSARLSAPPAGGYARMADGVMPRRLSVAELRALLRYQWRRCSGGRHAQCAGRARAQSCGESTATSSGQRAL